MVPDSGLYQLKVGLGDGPFSDGDGQHCHCISDRNNRRQQKMHEIEKNYRWNLTGNLTRLWVEIKNRGLKTGRISGSLTY